jgi:hypothetical protein
MAQSFISTSFIIEKEQALWAFGDHNSREFRMITLKTALDHEGQLGSFVTFTISKVAALRLAVRRGDPPDDTTVSEAEAATLVTRKGVSSALKHASSSFLNIPTDPNLPFVTLWVTQDIGKHISAENCVPIEENRSY